ncbi:succinyldiaminopimelate transaminase [Amphibiibacter pelophylacis]|uniref:Succinyldiaminopimelate transaminase n=1 Tax=Amphibiibacter pelophylacis TaxID=1799477 RepID=A0ACC6P2Y1_9BURK
MALNPRLDALQPYPFERWRQLVAHWQSSQSAPAVSAPSPISLGMGEPRHATPALIPQTLDAHRAGLSSYPATKGEPFLRQACADWVQRRYGVALDAEREVLPVLGTREALFSLAQALVDPVRAPSTAPATVIAPNPFYQIYEGAALLAGAQPVYANCLAPGFEPDWSSIPDGVWPSVQLLYTCSPGNPTGAVTGLDGWRELFERADRHGFVIASDECYSEIYPPGSPPPLGALQAAQELGRGFERLVVFTSLSKRSNAPGLRSGFVAGDAKVLAQYLLYRTYHGSAMSLPVQHASAAAWADEAHVEDNRQQYDAKFRAVTPLVQSVLDVQRPPAGFYLWAGLTPSVLDALQRRYGQPLDEHGTALSPDIVFALALLAETGVTVLPGSLLARTSAGVNPGRNRLRLALVSPLDETVQAAQRLAAFVHALG